MSVVTKASVVAAERSPLRWLAAAMSLVVAAAHLPITGEHLSEAPYIGWSFVALEVASVLLAVALVVRDSARVWLAAAAIPTLALAAYLLTRTVTMPQIADDKGNWSEPLSYVALTTELLLVVTAVAHGRIRAREGSRWRLLGLLALALGVAATWWAASIFSG